MVTYAEIPASASISCQVSEQGLSPASGFEHHASTLPTRFPPALGIGHGSALRASLLHSQ